MNPILRYLTVSKNVTSRVNNRSQRYIKNPVKHPKWSFLRKYVTVSSCQLSHKRLLLRYLTGFWIHLYQTRDSLILPFVFDYFLVKWLEKNAYFFVSLPLFAFSDQNFQGLIQVDINWKDEFFLEKSQKHFVKS